MYVGLNLIDFNAYSLNHNVTHSFFDHISHVCDDRFGRSLRFCHLEFDKEAIYDGCKSKNARYQWWVLNLK